MDFLSGLHPKVVHFPIAFFLAYVLLEIIGAVFKKDFFSKTAYLFLFLGVLGAVAAVLTGNAAQSAAKIIIKSRSAVQMKAIGNHETFATLTMWYFTGLLVLRTVFTLRKNFKGKIKLLMVLLALGGGYLVYHTGELGGQLVYKYGVGTQLIKNEVQHNPGKNVRWGKNTK